MTAYTSQELIAAAKAYIAAEAIIMTARPAGVPRAAWRMENIIDLPVDFLARDTALKAKPVRSLSFDLNGNPYDLWVWTTTGRTRKVIERIDLRAADATARLARYERL